MPITVILLLVTAPILTLFMMFGNTWSSHALDAARLGLAASITVVVVWVIVDASRALADRWRRFTSRPY